MIFGEPADVQSVVTRSPTDKSGIPGRSAATTEERDMLHPDWHTPAAGVFTAGNLRVFIAGHGGFCRAYIEPCFFTVDRPRFVRVMNLEEVQFFLALSLDEALELMVSAYRIQVAVRP